MPWHVFKLLLTHCTCFDLLCTSFALVGRYGKMSKIGLFIGRYIGYFALYVFYYLHRITDHPDILWLELRIAGSIRANKFLRRMYYLLISLTTIVLVLMMTDCLMQFPAFYNLSAISHVIIFIFASVAYALQLDSLLDRHRWRRLQPSYAESLYQSMVRMVAAILSQTSFERNRSLLKFAVYSEMLSYHDCCRLLRDHSQLPRALNQVIIDFLFLRRMKQLWIENLLFILIKKAVEDNEKVLRQIVEFMFGEVAYGNVNFKLWYRGPRTPYYEGTIRMCMKEDIPMRVIVKRHKTLLCMKHDYMEYDVASKQFLEGNARIFQPNLPQMLR